MRRSVVYCALIILLSAFSCQLSAAFAAEQINYARAERLFLEGRYADVVACATALIDRRAGQQDEIYYIKGLSELKLKKFDDARASFRNIADNYPRSKRALEAYIGIGDSYLLAGNTGAAAATYNEALRRFPKDQNIAVVRDRLASCPAGPAASRSQATPPAAPPVKGSAPLMVVPKRPAQVTVVIQPPVAQKEYDVIIQPSGNFSVQVGSFRSKKNAEKLARKLADGGYESHIAIPVAAGDGLFRVKVGRNLSQEGAEALAAKLKRSGYSTKICNGEACQ